MPECVVCGLEDFEERDGLYFCTTCQTQTQELIVEEEEFDEQADTGQAIVDRRLQIRKKKERSPKEIEYKGRPWTIYEAYQIILKHQVQAFIALGAHPKLEEYVFRLWALYLSKLQVAFTDDEQIYPQVLKKHVRHREKYYGSLENPITPAVRNVRSHKKRTVNKITHTVSPASLEGEEIYAEDDPTQSMETEDKYSSSEDDEEDGYLEVLEQDLEEGQKDEDATDRPERTQAAYPKETINRVMTSRLEWVSLPKLLSLCHIGILYTNSLTTATEIVRWVEEGEIPYTEVSTLLPEEFQYGSYDPQLFAAQIPKPHALRHLTGNLAHFMDIKKLPPVPVSQLVSRFILMLDLPGEFHGLVMSVMSTHPPQCQFVIKSAGASASLPFFDALAMGYIILTLKLWFGLDDDTEKKLSSYSRDVIQLTEDKYDLFVFDDWKAHIARKFPPNKEKVSLFSPGDVSDVQDIDSFLESYYKSNQHRRRPPRYAMTRCSKKGDDYNRYQQSTKEDLAYPFKLAGEKMKKASDRTKGQGHEDQKQESSESESRKFICSSMRHITNPDTFLSDLDRHGLSDDTIYSSCIESEDDLEDDDSLMYSGMETMSIDSSYDEGLAPKPKRHKSAAKEVVKKVFSKIQSDRKHWSEEFQSKMAGLRKKCVRACENYLAYKRVLWKNRNSSLEVCRHKCYCWLVNLCSRIIRCTPYELDVFVLQLSSICFSFSTRRMNLNAAEITRFKNKYFGYVEDDS